MGGLSTLGAGGPILVVLGLLSILSLTLIVVKILQLMPVRSGEAARAAALDAWREGKRDEARAALSQGRAPADRVTGFAMQALGDGKGGQALMAVLSQRGNHEFSRMTSLLRLLELIAMIAPLLGLLGTVLGMIQSFQELELAQGSANAAVLAGGIWEALLTTAAGLLVAIPAAVGASLLMARAEGGAQMIEQSVSELLLIEDSATKS